MEQWRTKTCASRLSNVHWQRHIMRNQSPFFPVRGCVDCESPFLQVWESHLGMLGQEASDHVITAMALIGLADWSNLCHLLEWHSSTLAYQINRAIWAFRHLQSTWYLGAESQDVPGLSSSKVAGSRDKAEGWSSLIKSLIWNNLTTCQRALEVWTRYESITLWTTQLGGQRVEISSSLQNRHCIELTVRGSAKRSIHGPTLSWRLLVKVQFCFAFAVRESKACLCLQQNCTSLSTCSVLSVRLMSYDCGGLYWPVKKASPLPARLCLCRPMDGIDGFEGIDRRGVVNARWVNNHLQVITTCKRKKKKTVFVLFVVLTCHQRTCRVTLGDGRLVKARILWCSAQWGEEKLESQCQDRALAARWRHLGLTPPHHFPEKKKDFQAWILAGRQQLDKIWFVWSNLRLSLASTFPHFSSCAIIWRSSARLEGIRERKLIEWKGAIKHLNSIVKSSNLEVFFASFFLEEKRGKLPRNVWLMLEQESVPHIWRAFLGLLSASKMMLTFTVFEACLSQILPWKYHYSTHRIQG